MEEWPVLRGKDVDAGLPVAAKLHCTPQSASGHIKLQPRFVMIACSIYFGHIHMANVLLYKVGPHVQSRRGSACNWSGTIQRLRGRAWRGR